MTKPIYRMSEVGKCPRALSAMRLGYKPAEPPEYLARAAEEGKWHEQRIKAELLADGCFVHSEQHEVKLGYPMFDLAGHIDGMIVDKDIHLNGDILLEVKSMSQFEFDRWMRYGFEQFPEYGAQLTCYMAATKLTTALYLVKNRSSGYIDRREVTETPFELSDIINWLEEVEVSVGKGELKTVPFDPQRIQCQRCAYQYLCITKPEVTEVDKVTLDTAIEAYRTAKALVDKYEEIVNEARATLGNYARSLDTKRFIHNQLAVQVITQHRVSYDKKELEKTVPTELLAPARKEQDTEQLRINDMARETHDANNS